MNIIFLDIDGVLNYIGAKSQLTDGSYFVEDEKLQILKEMVDATGAEIVLSSSWRSGWTSSIDTSKDARIGFEESKNYFIFCAKLNDFGLNLLSEIPRIYGLNREANIRYWLSEWPGRKIEGYVILDDEAEKFSPNNEHLILTSKEKGLQKEHIAEAVRIINQTSKLVKRKHILVVDDIELNRAVLKAILCGEHEIYEATNGKEALAALKRTDKIDLVITDIQMPEMDGVELIRQIRADIRYNHISIIANTQFGNQQQEEDILALGANDFVYKPSTPKILELRVKNALMLQDL